MKELFKGVIYGQKGGWIEGREGLNKLKPPKNLYEMRVGYFIQSQSCQEKKLVHLTPSLEWLQALTPTNPQRYSMLHMPTILECLIELLA